MGRLFAGAAAGGGGGDGALRYLRSDGQKAVGGFVRATASSAGGGAVLGGAMGAVAPSIRAMGDRLFGRRVETYYRTMSPEDFGTLEQAGRIPATAETFISTDLSYAQRFSGVTVEVTTARATMQRLQQAGVRHRLPGLGQDGTEGLNKLVNVTQLKAVGKWPDLGVALFKRERDVLRIGLGRSGSLDKFNDAIRSIRKIP